MVIKIFLFCLICLKSSLFASVGIDLKLEKLNQLNQEKRYLDALLYLEEIKPQFLLSIKKIYYYELNQLVLLLENGLGRDHDLSRAYALIDLIEDKKPKSKAKSSFLAWQKPMQTKSDQFLLGLFNLKERLELLTRTSYKSLLDASKKAYATWGDKKHECYWTAVSTAKINGARGSTHWQWKADLSYRRKPLSAIPKAIEKGVLKPGMVIYVNKNPGTDPRSSNLANKPHWFTFLGFSKNDEPMFSDQYFIETDFKKMQSWVAGRIIDAFYDPYFR